MKTKNAFALRNFDATKILQRRYFRKLKMPLGTDEEILHALSVTDVTDETVDIMEKKLSTLRAIKNSLIAYSKLIDKHLLRYEKIGRYILIKNNVDVNINSLSLPKYFDYSEFQRSVTKLLNRTLILFNENEFNIRRYYQKNFLSRLKQYRQAAGLNQKQLAALINVTPMTMSRYERGERDVSTYTLIKLAKNLGVSVDELLGLKK